MQVYTDGAGTALRLVRPTSLLSYYQPYWGNRCGLSVRTKRYKLYSDGSFFDCADDPNEREDLSKDLANEEMKDVYRKLKDVLAAAPPAPEKGGGRGTTDAGWNVAEKTTGGNQI